MPPTRAFSRSLLLSAAAAPLVIGGQAVMEGVMMKSPRHVATAVRLSNGRIKLRSRRHEFLSSRWGVHRVPFVRGVFVLFETMALGLRELNWSAAQAGEEDEQLSSWQVALTLVVGVGLALALFKLFPLFLATLATRYAGGGNWTLNLLDGALKLVVFVLYIALIGRMADVKRLFRYHGAEHKAVNCYEAGAALTPRAAKRFTTKQARCGTTFVITVIATSVVVYLFIPFGASFWMKYLLRLALLPVIAGVAYEWTRFSGKYYATSSIVRSLAAPGMLFQRLTTKEPTQRQLEVAIAALTTVLKREKAKYVALG